MAVTEKDVLMKYRDSSGNMTLLYPITKSANVDGLDDAIRKQSVTTTGTGAAYLATVEGITALSAGVSFVMMPHTNSTSNSPTLNVNSLGAKNIRRRVSSSPVTTTTGATDDWLGANKPIRVMYDGTFWIADLPRPNATDLMGTVPIANGGTGATTAAEARDALGVTDAIEVIDEEIRHHDIVISELGTKVNKRALKPLIFENTTVASSAWKSGATEAGSVRTNYASITLSDVTANMYANVVFNPDDIDSYNFASVCSTADGTVTIYAETAPTSDITIPTIIAEVVE